MSGAILPILSNGPPELGATALAMHLAGAGLRINDVLASMLLEHHSHRTERRGCGFTQASRWLSQLINRARCERDVKEFGEGSRASWISVLQQFQPLTQGQALLRDLFVSTLAPNEMAANDLHPISPEKLKIGTCPLAEQYFLELACGRIRRGGRVNVILGLEGMPLMLEKRGLGDEHSAISVAPVQIFGVLLPAGSLVGLDYDDAAIAHCEPCRDGRGVRIPQALVRNFRYLRLTTLAVSEKDRKLTYSSHFEQQINSALFLPDTACITQLRDYAMRQL
jgi:hypothetical protein